ncbi:MAG: glycosyltransferase family 4 protein [Acidimicrobiales bacterium]
MKFAISDGASIPSCDVAIVTAWQTAEMVPAIRSQTRAVVQIAYDYEFWMAADSSERQRMAAAFALPDIVVATSSAVATMLRDAGREPNATIRCGINLDVFHVLRDPAERDACIGFVARPGSIKRCEDAIAALARVRDSHKIRSVAVGPGRIETPPWLHVVNAPSDDVMCSFYNDQALFLLPSLYEGWGLTAAEAMACGAAVVTTRNGGVEDFARDDVNALLVPPADPDSLAAACISLLDDGARRKRIVEAGLQTTRAMDWSCSVDALEVLLEPFG